MKILKFLLLLYIFSSLLSCTTQETVGDNKNERNDIQFKNLIAEGDKYFYDCKSLFGKLWINTFI